MCAEIVSTDRSKSESPYRLMVVGNGPAAVVAASEAARRGVRVALLPGEHLAETVPAAGSGETDPAVEPALAVQIRRIQARCGQGGPVELPDESGIDLFWGQPLFRDRHTVMLRGRELRFRKALIATGSVPLPVRIDGAEQNGCLTPETLAGLTELPRRMAVIGTGPDACQWAQGFCRLGSQVHLIGRDRTILPEEDAQAADVIGARLEQDGVRSHLGCHELAIETTGNLQAVVIGRNGRKEKLLVDRVLICGPRRPNTSGFGLEAAGVAYSDRGVVVGERLRTTTRGIFAAGAVCGMELASPEAAEVTARLAVHNALSLVPRRLNRLVIPCCIRTDPALARVGLTLAEAQQRQIETAAYWGWLNEADASLGERRRQGFIAVYTQRPTGRIIGAVTVAEDADELIAPLVLLMTRRWPLAALAEVAFCRPSRLEVLVDLARQSARNRRSRLSVLERWLPRRRRREIETAVPTRETP